ncbi:MAG: histone family protein DNA-binding protein [Actinomycetia bacterium]|nr:histone family protein DNA-binding protein [Actinomycetes bacterium]
MNRSELIAAVAAGTGGDQAEARLHVDAVFDTIIRSVAAGEKVVVTGFGTFERLARPARTVRNPRTGQPIDLAASHAPRFSVGRTFKEQVSGAEAVPAVPEVTPAAAETEPAKAEKTSKRKDAAAAKAESAESKKGKASLKTTSKKAKGEKTPKPAKAKAKAAKSRKPGHATAPASKKATRSK